MFTISVDKNNKKRISAFGNLKAGTIFKFLRLSNSDRYYMFIKPMKLEILGNEEINCAVQLFGKFDIVTASKDEKVIIFDVTLNISN